MSRFIIADVFDGLATLDDNSVDLVMSSPPFLALRSYLPADHPDKGKEIGSEPTPADFIDTLLDVVEACDRVLAPHGSLVFELGDTYAGGAGGDYQPKFRQGTPRWDGRPEGQVRTTTSDPVSYPPRPRHSCWGGTGWPMDKSLSGIPTLFAWSLAYGRNLLRPERETPQWRIRNIVAWCRPNPPVGALGDKVRPATSYLTVATKARDRYFDLDAVRHENPRANEASRSRAQMNRGAPGYHTADDDEKQALANPAGAPPLDYWVIPTAPYKGSHYATYPPELCRIPVLSMCPQRVCVACGEPSRRTQVENPDYAGRGGTGLAENNNAQQGKSLRGFAHVAYPPPKYLPGSWTDCGHDSWRRGVVLDPFAGSGTTLAVATGHGRDAIGIDIDERNADLARERVGMFLSIETPALSEHQEDHDG